MGACEGRFTAYSGSLCRFVSQLLVEHPAGAVSEDADLSIAALVQAADHTGFGPALGGTKVAVHQDQYIGAGRFHGQQTEDRHCPYQLFHRAFPLGEPASVCMLQVIKK